MSVFVIVMELAKFRALASGSGKHLSSRTEFRPAPKLRLTIRRWRRRGRRRRRSERGGEREQFANRENCTTRLDSPIQLARLAGGARERSQFGQLDASQARPAPPPCYVRLDLGALICCQSGAIGEPCQACAVRALFRPDLGWRPSGLTHTQQVAAPARVRATARGCLRPAVRRRAHHGLTGAGCARTRTDERARKRAPQTGARQSGRRQVRADRLESRGGRRSARTHWLAGARA